MVFFTCSTIKTVDDHCGYALPWDPLQHITKNNAAYHDIHHQSWGIKTNFSQPFFTIWDGWMGTMWKGGDVKLRYERARKVADQWWEEQRKLAADRDKKIAQKKVNGTAVFPAPAALVASQDESVPVSSMRRSPRKAASSSSSSGAQLKGLRERMSGSLPSGVPRVESRR
jgi:sphinganine C4-monooxygenase